MDAVVPAAGRGTRLGSLTDEAPKGLVDVAGRPLLSYVLETLVDASVDELIVVVGYEGERIVDHYGDSYGGVPITYVWQREQLGLGHAVLQAAPHVDGPFVVLNGDNVFGGGIEPAIRRATTTDVDAVLLVEDVSREEAAETGVVEVENGRITGLREKPDEPSSTLVTTGCVLPESVFHACRLLRPSPRGEYELSEAVHLLVESRHVVEFVRSEDWRVNINERSDIADAAELLARED